MQPWVPGLLRSRKGPSGQPPARSGTCARRQSRFTVDHALGAVSSCFVAVFPPPIPSAWDLTYAGGAKFDFRPARGCVDGNLRLTKSKPSGVSRCMNRAVPLGETPPAQISPATLTHLQQLEAESIHIMREVVAECDRPVMLYSIGKDSSVMLHLAVKAFHPALPPFPLLHVDTTWKFRAMYEFRDATAKRLGLQLLVHVNQEGLRLGIGPFSHGSQVHTDVMKTEALKQALDQYGFDAAFGGARRDEEKSRAKERIFSFRSAQPRWDPRQQRPGLWALYNARKRPGESLRVFPLSNWTELDVWQYIWLEQIAIVPLYFAALRPVVQ